LAKTANYVKKQILFDIDTDRQTCYNRIKLFNNQIFTKTLDIMRTLTIIQIIFKGSVSLFIITYLLVQCSTKQTETPEIKIAKPVVPLTIWDKIKKYEPQEVPTPTDIEFQVLALIEKAKTRGYNFEKVTPRTIALQIDFTDGSFNCYKTNGEIDQITCFIGNSSAATYENSSSWVARLHDKISSSNNCSGFGLIRSQDEEFLFDGVTLWPGIPAEEEATKAQLDDINKKYLAFLRYFAIELL